MKTTSHGTVDTATGSPAPDKDAKQLRMLGYLHWGFAAFGLVTIVSLAIQYNIFTAGLNSQDLSHLGAEGVSRRAETAVIMIVFFSMVSLVILASSVLNLLSGFFILKRRRRIFSVVVALVNTVQIPLGMALGIFTVIVLMRDSVRLKYATPPLTASP
jgi:hypothetical protein